MLARVFTATLQGLDAIKVEVEVVGRQGVPGLVLIGLPNQAVNEAKERITTALRSVGVRIRSKRTVVNLAPAEVKKTSACLELAIAVGLLKMYGEVKAVTDDTLFLGELSLDGSLKPIVGILGLTLAAQRLGFRRVIFPQANCSQVQPLQGLKLCPAQTLTQVLNDLRQQRPLPVFQPPPLSVSPPRGIPDLAEIKQQATAKRALEIAAAGNHSLLMIGPPGAGKTMLAHSLPGILPPLSESESLEVMHIHSLVPTSPQPNTPQRPFRAPHHSTSRLALLGGGSQLLPGEITLAHRGVLFLDEVAEFSRATLEALRQPLEAKSLSVSRPGGQYCFPADCLMIAATNPCPCGYAGSETHPCQCSPWHVAQYRHKLSGPLLDRIDLHVTVRAVNTTALVQDQSEERSLQVRQRVIAARTFRQQRAGRADQLLPTALALLETAAGKLKLSARSYFKVIKVSRTIADLEGSVKITPAHVAEALQYRPQGIK